MVLNNTLHEAKRNKNDEFYTQLEDIEEEMRHYKDHFRDKVVYCNCDDPTVSNFFFYFSRKFKKLGLKKLITTCYKNQDRDLFSSNDQEQAIYLEYSGTRNENGIYDEDEVVQYPLQGNGDFRSEECVQMLKEADIVVTNPPFSLFREYIAQLIKYDKKFLVLGNPNAITYKEIFPLIKKNKLWVGNKSMGTDMLFDIPKHYAEKLIETKKEGSAYKIVDGVVKGRAQSIWFTNLDYSKRNEDLILCRKYSSEEYPTYDNYNAINVDKVSEIPKDYGGEMGVPITFLGKHNPDQFEIVRFRKGDDDKDFSINGKTPYFRIAIRNRRLQA